jgi:hypothetical protein
VRKSQIFNRNSKFLGIEFAVELERHKQVNGENNSRIIGFIVVFLEDDLQHFRIFFHHIGHNIFLTERMASFCSFVLSFSITSTKASKAFLYA